MHKNTSGQKLTVYVWDSTSNLPKTGDAANLTAYRSLDDGAVTVLGDTSATELDATNAKGFYVFDLTQGETNGDKILFSCKSATANMVCLAMPAVIYTVPAALGLVAGAAGGLFIAGTNAATTVTTAFTSTFTGNLTGSAASVTGAVGSVTGAVGSVTGMTASDVGAIKAKTDNLPTDPADESLIIAATDALVTLIGEVPTNAELATALTNLDATVSSRAASATALSTVQWTTARAGYLDNLNTLKIKKNAALAKFGFLMVLASDHISPATGKTVACQRSLDGGAFANCNSATATEISAGAYYVDLAAADMNADIVILKFTNVDCDQRIVVIATEP